MHLKLISNERFEAVDGSFCLFMGLIENKELKTESEEDRERDGGRERLRDGRRKEEEDKSEGESGNERERKKDGTKE